MIGNDGAEDDLMKLVSGILAGPKDIIDLNKNCRALIELRLYILT